MNRYWCLYFLGSIHILTSSSCFFFFWDKKCMVHINMLIVAICCFNINSCYSILRMCIIFSIFFLRTDIFNKGMHKLIPIDHDPQIQGACIYFYIFSKTLQDRSANHMADLKTTFPVSMRRWWGSLNFFLLVGKIRMSVSFAQGAAIYTYIHTHIYTHTCIYACVIVCLHLIFFF